MHLLFTFPWVDPRNNPREHTGTPENPREPQRNGIVLVIFFSLPGKGVVSFWKQPCRTKEYRGQTSVRHAS